MCLESTHEPMSQINSDRTHAHTWAASIAKAGVETLCFMVWVWGWGFLTHIINPSRDDHISVLLSLKDREGSLETDSSGVTLRYSETGAESLNVGGTGKLGQPRTGER